MSQLWLPKKPLKSYNDVTMTNQARWQIIFFIILLVGVSILNFFILKPYLGVMFLAVVLALAFYPYYEKVLAKFGGRKNLASAIALAIICILILIPAVFITIMLFQEAANLYVSLVSGGVGQTGTLASLTQFLQGKLNLILPNIKIDLAQYLQTGLGWLISNLDVFFSSFVSLLMNLFLLLISLFYLFKNGDQLVQTLTRLSPLDDNYDNKILTKISASVNSVVRGSFIIALVQGLLTGFGFFIFGVPNPILWALVAAVASFVPFLGTALVTVPGIIYLFIQGSLGASMGLLIWGVLAVSLVDNALVPLLLKRGIPINSLLILLSVLGGVSFLGPVGFLAGPIILSLLFVLFEIYPLIIKK